MRKTRSIHHSLTVYTENEEQETNIEKRKRKQRKERTKTEIEETKVTARKVWSLGHGEFGMARDFLRRSPKNDFD